MDHRRRAFRPEVVGTLEDRLVLSAAATGSVAAFNDGPQMHPVVVATFAGSDKAEVIAKGGKPDHGQVVFHATVMTDFGGSGGPATVGLYEVDYENETSKTITSATIEDTLASDLAYVPTGADVPVAGEPANSLVRVAPNVSYFSNGSHVPPGGQLDVTTNAKGAQVVELNLPGGIAAGAKGSLEFEAEEVTPKRS